MERLMKILLMIALVVPFCTTLSALAQGPFISAKVWQPGSYVPISHSTDAKGPVQVANGDDSPKAEPQKTVVEEKPKQTTVEPEVKKAEPAPIEEKPKQTAAEPEVKKAEPAPIEKKPAGGAEVKTEVEGTKPIEEKPKLEEKSPVLPETRSAGFFSDVDYRGIGAIVESKEGKTLLVQGDIVYVAFRGPEEVLVGNRYDVFHASEPVGDPDTGKRIGRRYNIMGAIQIIDRYGRFYTAKIVEAFDGICKGDYIRPYYNK